MAKYFVKRILMSIVIMFGITVIVFFLIKLAPGDPIEAMYAKVPGMTQEELDHKKAALGFDKPIIVQYGMYMSNVILRGDFGMSIQYSRPVMMLIKERLWNTFSLTFISLILSVIIAIPIGVISATRQYTAFDYTATTFAFVGISIPSFFFGFLLIKVFSVDLGLLPSAGLQTAGNTFTGMARFVDLFKHAVMPVTVLALINVATYMRHMRSSMLEVIKQDYIRTARAKGLRERVVIYRHALRNALIPVVTIIGSSLAYLFSGSLITETIFSWPGLGRMIYSATMSRDYYVMMGVNIFIAFLVILGQFIADITLALVDPRIKLE